MPWIPKHAWLVSHALPWLWVSEVCGAVSEAACRLAPHCWPDGRYRVEPALSLTGRAAVQARLLARVQELVAGMEGRVTIILTGGGTTRHCMDAQHQNAPVRQRRPPLHARHSQRPCTAPHRCV